MRNQLQDLFTNSETRCAAALAVAGDDTRTPPFESSTDACPPASGSVFTDGNAHGKLFTGYDVQLCPHTGLDSRICARRFDLEGMAQIV